MSLGAARSPQLVLREQIKMTVFLECKYIKLELGLAIECCPQCHLQRGPDENPRFPNLINVRSFREGVYGDAGNTEWNIGVEGIVCCHVYDALRSLPREWWLEQARKHGVEIDDKKGYTFTDHPVNDTERAHGQTKTSNVKSFGKQKLKKDQEREEEGGLSGWLK